MIIYTAEEEERVDQVVRVLKAIAHPIRIQIIQLLNENSELTVSAIYQYLNLEQSLISYHLINMRDRGILDSRRQGKSIYYFLVDAVVADVIDQIDKSKCLPEPSTPGVN